MTATTTTEPALQTKPDTLYWAKTTEGPAKFRDSPSEILVIRADEGNWLGLFPHSGDSDDGTWNGWELSETNVHAVGKIPDGVIEGYAGSHRGWWLSAGDVTILRPRDFEEDLLPVNKDTPVASFDWAAKVAELEKQLADLTEYRLRAERDRVKGWEELDRFKEKVQEVAFRYAEAHDMCGVFDECMEELGLPRRETEHQVTVRCHFTTTVTVMATDEENAADQVQELGTAYGWEPRYTFFDGVDMSEPWDLGFEVE